MSRDVISDQEADELWRLKHGSTLHSMSAKLLRLKKVLWISSAMVMLCLLTIRLLPMRESQWSVLETSTEFTLYSLRAEPLGRDFTQNARIPVTKEKFAGSPVYGKTAITDPRVKAELLSALRRGIEENKGNVPACFEPRHAIQAVKGWRRISVVICFECSHMYIGEGGKSKRVLVTSTPQKVFDRVLTDAKVPLGWRPA